MVIVVRRLEYTQGSSQKFWQIDHKGASLHIAWASWSSLGIWRVTSRRLVRVAVVVYPLITTYAVMATANHYLADAVTGAALTLGVTWAVSATERRRGRAGRSQPR